MADKHTAWHRSVTRVKRVIEYGLHANDLNNDEMDEELRYAFDELAAAFGMPRPKWDEEGEEGEEG